MEKETGDCSNNLYLNEDLRENYLRGTRYIFDFTQSQEDRLSAAKILLEICD